MPTTWFIITRAIHIGACLLFFGIFAFDRCVTTAISDQSGKGFRDWWRTRLKFFAVGLLPIILLSGMFWLALVAMTMSGEPLGAGILKVVWNQTQFGIVWKIRSCLWLAAFIVAVCGWRRMTSYFIKLQLLLGGALLGTLAWAGHGQESSPWHLSADVLHLLVAGLWPSGLLPLALMLKKLQASPGPAQGESIAILVRRFSALSLVSVSLLTLTGLVNSWYLVGSVSNLMQEPYGRWLLLKLILFGIIIAIGAINLLRLKPRIESEEYQSQPAGKAVVRLQFNVRAELFLAMLVVIVVAVLGILPPANH